MWFLAGLALFFLWIPPLIAIYKYLEVYYWRYEFYERTMVERKGVFSVTRNETSYYRIKSILIEEPLWMRIFGLSNVIIKTSDEFNNIVTLYAVPNGPELRNILREAVDERRTEQGVKEFDLHSL
jgi:membrane protein YdbS with pleckstrin-like domain